MSNLRRRYALVVGVFVAVLIPFLRPLGSSHLCLFLCCCQNGKCYCHPGYGGPLCKEEAVCLNDCSGVGLCLAGKCHCESGFSGEDCSLSLKAKPSEVHGCPSDCSGECALLPPFGCCVCGCCISTLQCSNDAAAPHAVAYAAFYAVAHAVLLLLPTLLLMLCSCCSLCCCS